ncbi:putative flagellar protein FlgJ, N-terminal [Magnetospirillum sp. LM-5]|uniref:rod-binding protein n=1 Tax=Magnetospirillum sp. LM-5 TaxID=2681466 RepID=UPI00137E07B7|nr:rod-binding protein [Magnetospirillum sp. LM-5]CAA7620817.1 putative flagellar protein FlgJ, N-terminal [Magnetospirillum sp. LM-5]
MTMTASLLDNARMAASQPAQTPQHAANVARAKAVGKQFESMFMSQMLNHMFTGIDQEKGLFGGGHAEAMFRPMLNDEYAKMITNRGNGIGLADQVTRAMLAHQEV